MKRFFLILLLVGCATGQAVAVNDNDISSSLLYFTDSGGPIYSITFEDETDWYLVNLTSDINDPIYYYKWHLPSDPNHTHNVSYPSGINSSYYVPFGMFCSRFDPTTFYFDYGAFDISNKSDVLNLSENITIPCHERLVYSNGLINESGFSGTDTLLLDLNISNLTASDSLELTYEYIDEEFNVTDLLDVGGDYTQLAGWNNASLTLDLILGEHCSNDIDDDVDGYTDCEDSDCDSVDNCEYRTELTCDDGIDNDVDDDTDCLDSDCDSVDDCEYRTELTCDDDIDNDADGDTDCSDSDCVDQDGCEEYLPVETYVEPEEADYASLISDTTADGEDSTSDSDTTDDSSTDDSSDDDTDDSSEDELQLCLETTMSVSIDADLVLSYDDDEISVSVTPDDELPDYVIYLTVVNDDGDQELFTYEEVDSHDDEETTGFDYGASEDDVVTLQFYTAHPSDGGSLLFESESDVFVESCD